MRGRRLWLLAPLLLLLGLVFLRTIDPAPLVQLRNAVFDQYQRLKPRHQDLEKSFVRIVDIDDDSLRRLGQWPWPRDQLARLLRTLQSRGAVVIALDLVLAEPDRLSPAQLAKRAPFKALGEQLKALPDTDAELARALAAGPVITATVLNHTRNPGPPSKTGFAWAGYDPAAFIFSFSGAVTNLAAFDQAAAGVGAINYIAGADQIIRRIPTVLRIRKSLYPSLFAETLRVASGAGGFKIRTSGASGETGGQTGITALQIGRAPVPTDANGQLMLYFAQFQAARLIPAWKVFAGQAPAGSIRNRIILIGSSAAGLKDLRATPLGRNVPGVVIHAQAIDQVLSARHLRRPDYAAGMETTVLAIAGLILLAVMVRFGALASTAAFVLLIGGLIAGSWFGFSRQGLLFDPSWPVVSLGSLFLLTMSIRYLATERQRNQVRTAFGRYLAPAMVERLAGDPSALKLGGETRELTILFSDVRGFTDISERFDAAGLTALMNNYLTPMTEAILARGGTIDKYMGDAIMAFWNAPLPTADHPRAACLAALDMIERLKQVNDTIAIPQREDEETPPRLRIGIGVNTGPCSVGNMGSSQRFDYSALGDDVNLASRLEGMSKQYGVDIVLGEATRQAVPDLACLELDLIRVKGKQAPTRIYALLGAETLAGRSAFENLIAGQSDFLAAYRGRQWQSATEQAKKLATEKAQGPWPALDAYYAMMVKRIDAFIAEPALLPTAKEPWDGVFNAQSK